MIENLIDLTYELEGLLLLAASGDTDAQKRAHLLRLAARKARLIADQASDEAPEEEETDFTPQSLPPMYDAEPDAEPVVEEERMEKAAILGETQRSTDLKKMFSLNDKFRFRRELFGGSDVDFNSCLQMLESLETIEEAEDYVYNDLRLDPENPEVAAFMQVVEKRYL